MNMMDEALNSAFRSIEAKLSNDNVTIDRKTAQKIAAALRDLAGIVGPGTGISPLVRKYADILDPPQSSLRDELIAKMDSRKVDELLALVHKHVERLEYDSSVHQTVAWQRGYSACRDDVLDLLGDTDE